MFKKNAATSSTENRAAYLWRSVQVLILFCKQFAVKY